jgi:hypothetical protein
MAGFVLENLFARRSVTFPKLVSPNDPNVAACPIFYDS